MGGGRVVLSSPLCLSGASRTKTPTLPPCVCACVCAFIVDINNHARLFTNDSAVNNLNSFPFENRLFSFSCVYTPAVNSQNGQHTHTCATHAHTKAKTRKCTFTETHIFTEGITLPYSSGERERERDRNTAREREKKRGRAGLRLTDSLHPHSASPLFCKLCSTFAVLPPPAPMPLLHANTFMK